MVGLLNAARFHDSSSSGVEETSARPIKFRLPSLNVDIVTYAMLRLAGDDHEALLDPAVLYDTANRAFATLFQDFVNHNVSLTHGGWMYEPFYAPTAASVRARAEDTSSSAVGEGQVTLENSRSIEVLKMSPVVAGISIAVLCCLIAIALLVVI